MDNAHEILSEKQKLQKERSATRARLKATKIAAKALSVWLEPALAGNEIKTQEAGDRWLGRLGEENIRRLAMRMRRMADWELVRAEQMRDTGASSWMLLKYLGASQDLVLDGPACRDTIYTEVLLNHARRTQAKPREALLKFGIPLAVIATTAVVVTAGVGFVATLAAPYIGVDPGFTAAVWKDWQSMFVPVLQKVKSLGQNYDVASAGLAFVIGAFWMWAHDSRVSEDLRHRASEKEVPNLEQGIGFAAKGHRIQAAIRAIPVHERVLLGHLSSTDLRAFLLSPDIERMHMLRENRPPIMAQFKSVLASRSKNLASLVPTIRDLTDVCLPKRWARAIGAEHPGEISLKRMESWRVQRNTLDVPAENLPRKSFGL